MPERFELETRQFFLRAEEVDVERGIIRGVGVPYETPVRIRDWAGEYEEQFARGSVEDDGALAFWRHDEPIGVVTEATEADAGRAVVLQISDTTLGRDALTLARDLQRAGRPLQLSVGFVPGGDHTVEERENDVPLVTRTRVIAREYSLVPFGAYGEGASVTEVRERPANPIKENRMTDTTEATELAELRARYEELERTVETMQREQHHEEEPVLDTRSAAEVLKAIVAGDEATIRQYNDLMTRAYAGGTTADAAIKDGWVGDLTRIVETSSGVLASLFSEGTLPATGMNIEYAELDTNTVAVAEQAAEGDDLTKGNVKLTTKTAPVKTDGGATELTRQEIERSSLPILQRHLDALALAAGGRAKARLRTSFGTLKTAREAIAANGGVVVLGATLAASTYDNWVSALVDAAIKYDAIDLELEALVTSGSVFKKLAGLKGSDGRPMFSLDDSGSNTIGRLNVKALNGSLLNLPVVLDAGQAGDSAAFTNGRALRVYKTPVAQLQDETILNLTKQYAVYRYTAIAAEIPAALVPVKLAAA